MHWTTATKSDPRGRRTLRVRSTAHRREWTARLRLASIGLARCGSCWRRAGQSRPGGRRGVIHVRFDVRVAVRATVDVHRPVGSGLLSSPAPNCKPLRRTGPGCRCRWPCSRRRPLGCLASGQGVCGRSSLASVLRIEAATGLPPVSWISTVASRPTIEVGVRFQITWIRLPPSPLGAIAAET